MKLFLASVFATVALACYDAFSSDLASCALSRISLTDGCANDQTVIDCAKELSKGKCEFTADTCVDLIALAESNCTLTCTANDESCFPATSTVELESGKHINMDQLQVGDRVRVGPSEFSEVYFFSTEMIQTTSKFVQLSTDSGAVTLTKGHYLYVNGVLKVANDAKVGDILVLGNGNQVVVTEVSSVWAAGLYNPHTLHGDIVVDGVHTSTYTDAVHPTLAHVLLSPLRTMYSAGISFGKDFRDTAKGMPSWLRKAFRA